MSKKIVVLGDQFQSGAYILRINVQESVAIHFGRFRQGDEITVPAGNYAYVGSAMAKKGATTLARRLARHATRTGRAPAHSLRATMVEELLRSGLGSGDLLPRGPKRLHWHIDYLLNELAVDLEGVVVVRSPIRLEQVLAEVLSADRRTAVLAPGLGATDHAGTTHLLQVPADDAWWAALIDEVEARRRAVSVG